MRCCTFALAVFFAVPIFGADVSTLTQAGLRVHEWGTFTSVAGESGEPQPWTPLAGPSDLPCFVYHLGNKCVKCLLLPQSQPVRPQPVVTASTVRMETPVLYFYAPKRMALSVRVDFPQGWITEWYPQSSRVTPDIQLGDASHLPTLGQGHIEWNNVEVSPGMQASVPTGQGASHYYAARNTDSDPILVGGQAEKLIFYRGIADFAVPLSAKVLDERRVELRNTARGTLPLVILFENRGGKTGYRTVREFHGSSEIEMPQLTAGPEALKGDLANALVDMGLYPKEAAAMLETWRDSWFEEGLRVFYLMPRRSIDDVLPLAVTPRPAATERVFVGRVEMLSPFRRQRLETALTKGDTTTLASYGRFLEPFARQIPGGATANPVTSAFFKALLDQARGEFDSPSCVR
jgi:hypothetical protein